MTIVTALAGFLFRDTVGALASCFRPRAPAGPGLFLRLAEGRGDRLQSLLIADAPRVGPLGRPGGPQRSKPDAASAAPGPPWGAVELTSTHPQAISVTPFSFKHKQAVSRRKNRFFL